MKSQGLQELIGKIFSDDKTRKQFESEPDKVISQFNLTDKEKKAVMTTHAKLGLVTGDAQHLEAAIDPNAIWL